MRQRSFAILLSLLAFVLSAQCEGMKRDGLELPSDDGRLAGFSFHGEELLRSLNLKASSLSPLVAAPGKLDLHLLEVAAGKKMANMQQSEWSYVQYQMPLGTNHDILQWVRHLVMVDPDVLLVYDEIKTRPKTEGEWELSTGAGIKYDEQQHTVDLMGEKCGATVKFLIPGEKSSVLAVPTVDESKHTATVHWSAGSEPVVRLLMVIVTHDKGRKRSLAFKRLDSFNAAGARIHRDGYPTLVAVRNHDLSNGARLGGMDFDAPARVYVSRAGKKK